MGSFNCVFLLDVIFSFKLSMQAGTATRTSERKESFCFNYLIPPHLGDLVSLCGSTRLSWGEGCAFMECNVGKLRKEDGEATVDGDI